MSPCRFVGLVVPSLSSLIARMTSTPYILAVAITKGGTGKTTTASTLAVELASAGAGVVLVDCDTQGQAAHALGVAPANRGPGLAGVIGGTVSVGDALREARGAGEGRGAVYLLAGSAALASEAASMASDPAAGLLAVRDAAIAACEATGARFVVLDTPPGWGPLSLGALAAADAVLSPLPPHALAVEALATFDRHLSSVQRTRAAFGGDALPALSFVLPTMVAPRGVAPATALEAVAAWAASHRDRPVVLGPVPRTVRVEEAPMYGLAVTEHAPDHPAAAAYRDAARVVRERAARPR